MSSNPKSVDPEARWHAVYGAMVALMMDRRRQEEIWLPAPEQMAGIVRVAIEAADRAEKAFQAVEGER
jgi:hypothetical protein